MLHLFTNLEFHTGIMLVIALIFVFFYEAINGFHDTANAVATVIYTRALRPHIAVAMSGIFNFLGVLMGGLSVAYAIVHLLPTDLLLNASSSQGVAMIFSILLAAVLWNFGTWYFGLPASSSHALIGAIMGIGLTNAFENDSSVAQALNISKLIEIFLSLIISPLVGLILANVMVFILHRYWSSTKKRRKMHLTPAEREKKDGKRKPSFWTRIGLIFAAASVSFSHGANDGQKGIGVIMLALISIFPFGFALEMNASAYDIRRTCDAAIHLQQYYKQHYNMFIRIDEMNTTKPPPPGQGFYCDPSKVFSAISHASFLLHNLDSYQDLNVYQRVYMRRLLMCISETAGKIAKLPEIPIADKRFLLNLHHDLLYTVEYAPIWIVVAVALALSLGTMVGWRRVATTIGEKIGKKEMTYAQGLAAQITAAVSIGVASYTGMPVSTTHVLASAVTGTMLARGGGVHRKTIKNILLAWVLTVPTAIILASSLYWLALKVA